MVTLGVRPDLIDRYSGESALQASMLLATLLEYTVNPDGSNRGGSSPLALVVHELNEAHNAERRQTLYECIASLLRAGANPHYGCRTSKLRCLPMISPDLELIGRATPAELFCLAP